MARALAFLLLVSLAECGGTRPSPPPPPTVAPAPGQSWSASDFTVALTVEWDPAEPQDVVIDFALQNLSGRSVTFHFRNAGRVCGVFRSGAKKEVYRFPQFTAQVLGTETLADREDRNFIVRVPLAELRDLPPGDYSVDAWLCGYDNLRAQTQFALPELPE